MPKKKTTKATAEVGEVAKGGEVIVMLNARHVYKIWGVGPKDEKGDPTNKLLATLTFGENLISAEAWAKAQERTDVRKALERGTLREVRIAEKGEKISKPEADKSDSGSDDGADDSD